MSLIKVSANSRASAVAGAIVGIIRNHQLAEVHAINEEAVNRALKAVDLAMGNFNRDGIHVHCVLEFAPVTIDEDTRTAIRLIVEPQSSHDLPIQATWLAA